MENLIQLILLSSLVSVPGSSAENLAFKGTATQSSTYSTWSAKRAIDGLRNVPYCIHTSIYSTPWWRLDLQDYYDVSTVIITARSDCCLDETRGAEIRIGNSLENNGNNNPICAVTPGFLLGQSISFSCLGMKGRYVNVVRSGSTSILALCEVEVYGVHRQKTFLRLKFSSSGDVAAESDKILHQLQSALGLNISDFKLSWTQLPKKEEEQEEDGGSCVKHL
ncbi:fucolectin-like isoform X2 [Triplophysa dalaica]|uniref:fucolectin-like isoform X2 n=1 Tax=Triplophysa dalaica TaxID=1582913 RepID=UPI0024DF6F22|nr:fucolectin-like isoform X2 [Triplophysa dalaica]